MKRKEFLQKGLAASALAGSSAWAFASEDTDQNNLNQIDKKIEVNLLNTAKGPAGNNGVIMREKLAKEGKRLPILDGDDHTANFNYAKNFLFSRNKKLGEKYGLKYAEGFHYMTDIRLPNESPLDEYIKKNSLPL